MKLTRKDITSKDIKEFNEIFDTITTSFYHSYLDNDKIVKYFINKANELTEEKINWFFATDSRRNFNYEKI